MRFCAPSCLKKAVSFLWAASAVRPCRIASEARDCGESETTATRGGGGGSSAPSGGGGSGVPAATAAIRASTVLNWSPDCSAIWQPGRRG